VLASIEIGVIIPQFLSGLWQAFQFGVMPIFAGNRLNFWITRADAFR